MAAPARRLDRDRRPPLPRCDDEEDAVLAACLFEPGVIAGLDFLQPADFAGSGNAELFAAMRALHARGVPVDPHTLADELQRVGRLDHAGGKERIGFLLDAVPTAANALYHGRIVERHAQARLLAARLEDAVAELRRPGADPAAVAWDLGRAVSPIAAGADSEGARFRLLSADALADLPEPRPLVDGWLYEGSLAAIIAPYSSYKTFVALDLALCIARGYDWHGHTVRHGPVVYIAAEGRGGLAKRVTAWRALNGQPDAGAAFFVPQSVTLNDPADLAALLRALDGMDPTPVAIFVDTVARTLSGNENHAEDAGAYVQACDTLRERTGAAVVLVHHTGWEGTRSRGSSSLPAAFDTELSLTKDGDRVTIRASKQKDVPDGSTVLLEAVPIAASLAMRPVELRSAKLTENELAALNAAQSSGGLSPSAWLTRSELARGSFHYARQRLLTLAYVQKRGGKYHVTDAGRLAIGSTLNIGSTDAQPSRSRDAHSIAHP